MSKANDPHTIPASELEREVARLLIERIRRLIAEGHSIEGAADIACRGSGAWSEFRGYAISKISEEPDHD